MSGARKDDVECRGGPATVLAIHTWGPAEIPDVVPFPCGGVYVRVGGDGTITPGHYEWKAPT